MATDGSDNAAAAPAVGRDFIRDIVAADLEAGRHKTVVTRFPPEPNGYLHIGHAKAICLDFGLANEIPNSRCHLRFDDTNPATEETEYVEGIMNDVRWLGFDWKQHLYYASDYFEQLYAWAVELIRMGKAFVDDQTPDEIRANQGSLTEPGRESPFRNRSVEENLDLFARMRAGEFPEESRVLRAKIDMAASVVAMRDPILYRIQHKAHHRTGTAWCIYPMYDFAHPLSDALEHVTHSLCTLEFLDHRPLYDWVLDNVDVPSRPRQIEFARLNVGHMITSKRFLKRLVDEGHVGGWDDPRMPTIAAMRRRGYPARAIREFCDAIGIAKRDNLIELANLEFHVRQVLNQEALRRMAVLDPIKLRLCSEVPIPAGQAVPGNGEGITPFGGYVNCKDAGKSEAEFAGSAVRHNPAGSRPWSGRIRTSAGYKAIVNPIRLVARTDPVHLTLKESRSQQWLQLKASFFAFGFRAGSHRTVRI